MGVEARRHPRTRVHLRVKYRTAREFVEQYAHNLSVGGLFVSGATGFALREEITIELELPGHGTFRIVAEVAHLVPAGDATGRAPGAGLQIKRGPPGFEKALEAYLMRLGRRASATVFVDVEPWRQLVADAGYKVAPLPPPRGLPAVIGDASSVAVIAPDDIAQQYAAAVAFLGGAPETVIPVHPKLPVEPVLAFLDRLLVTK